MLLVIDFSNPYNRVAHLLEGSPISIFGIELEEYVNFKNRFNFFWPILTITSEKLFAEPEVEGLNQKQPIETSRAYDSLLSLFDRLSKYTQTLETESNSVTVRFHMNQITGALVISSNSELGESITESLRGNLQVSFSFLFGCKYFERFDWI